MNLPPSQVPEGSQTVLSGQAGDGGHYLTLKVMSQECSRTWVDPQPPVAEDLEPWMDLELHRPSSSPLICCLFEVFYRKCRSPSPHFRCPAQAAKARLASGVTSLKDFPSQATETKRIQ